MFNNHDHAGGDVRPPTFSVALFIAHLSAKRLAPATNSTYISAISYVDKLKWYADPAKVFLILKLLTAIKSRSRPDIRLPNTLPVLRLLVYTMKQASSSFSWSSHFIYSDVSDSILRLSTCKSRRNYLQSYEFGKFSVTTPRP